MLKKEQYDSQKSRQGQLVATLFFRHSNVAGFILIMSKLRYSLKFNKVENVDLIFP